MPPETRTKYRKLQRHPTRSMLGGVCAGVADYTGANCLSIRLLTLVLFVLPTGGLLLYLALWLVLPVGTQDDPDLHPSILSRLRQGFDSGGG
ncbi:MAG: PspC domain-containing protein [Caldilineaceae bacterium]|nr:PspC domain-containing protein [Caldilineaceae bacterium]